MKTITIIKQTINIIKKLSIIHENVQDYNFNTVRRSNLQLFSSGRVSCASCRHGNTGQEPFLQHLCFCSVLTAKRSLCLRCTFASLQKTRPRQGDADLKKGILFTPIKGRGTVVLQILYVPVIVSYNQPMGCFYFHFLLLMFTCESNYYRMFI